MCKAYNFARGSHEFVTSAGFLATQPIIGQWASSCYWSYLRRLRLLYLTQCDTNNHSGCLEQKPRRTRLSAELKSRITRMTSLKANSAQFYNRLILTNRNNTLQWNCSETRMVLDKGSIAQAKSLIIVTAYHQECAEPAMRNTNATPPSAFQSHQAETWKRNT